MKVALFLDGDCYNNDVIFDDSPENWLNHDNLLHVWINMKRYLNDRGIEIHTYDVYSDRREIDKAVFFGLYTPNSEHLNRMRELGTDCYYVAYEPPVIHHFNTAENLRSVAHSFRRILTHQDDLIDNKKFFRVSEGKVYPDISRVKKIPFSERYFMMMMNSYRYANFDDYREIYSERFRASKFFEQASDEFHVYGRGLNNPERIKDRWPHKQPIFFNSYAGEVESKMEVMCRYRFNLCFENCIGVYGYISEKIIHSFRGGVVPVYWGPVNPTDYFPADTFVDVRQFSDYAELYEHLKSIDESRFNEYLAAIDDYLDSELYEKFFGKEVFGRQMYQMLTDDEQPDSVMQISVEVLDQEKPSISILIPTRNRSELLAKSLDSLVKQNYPNIEPVIVDDESDDDTPQVVERFRESLPNMVYARNEKRIGPLLGFRKAAELASGDFLLNFSDDDLLTEGALEAYVAPLKRQPYDLIYSDLSVIDGDGNETSKWAYRNYPENRQLLRHLMDAGGNVIPEVLLIRRDIYSDVYGEMYSKRFITPFFLGKLNQLKMHHVGSPLYKYRVHKKSTFSDTDGLIVRNKGVINYMNLIMLSYNPVEVFQTQGAPTKEEQIVDSLIQYIVRLLAQAKRFFEGEFYTGSMYEEKDKLWAIFYEYASYWHSIALKYGVRKAELAQLGHAIDQRLNPEDYDPVEVNMLPSIYRQMPWFAYRPINHVADFAAFDMITIGHNDTLSRETYTLMKEGITNIQAINKVVHSIDEMDAHLQGHPIQVVNIIDRDLMHDAMKLLAHAGRYLLCIVNATGEPYPVDMSLFKNAITLEPTQLADFETYMSFLNQPVETRQDRSEAHIHA